MRKKDLLLADTFDALISKLEAFADQFDRLAKTTDQRKLADQFNVFVGEIIQDLSSPGEQRGGDLSDSTEMDDTLRRHGHETLAGLFAEIRADEAAGKHEDAHYYPTESLKTLLVGKAEIPAVERGKDKDIER
jgi:hypothetical protein